MWMSVEEMLSPIDKKDIEEQEICYEMSLYNLENIYKINIEHSINADAIEIVIYNINNQKTILATFPYRAEAIGGHKAYEKAKRYLSNIYKNAKEQV